MNQQTTPEQQRSSSPDQPARRDEPPMKIPEQQEPSGDRKTPDIQGEGNYDAARRYDQSAEKFARSGQVEQAARDAAPKSQQESRALADAEAEGKEHAKR